MPSRFLFLLYYYPPVLGTAPKRNFAISSALAAEAESAFILTATETPATPEEDHVKVQYISAWDYRRILRKQRKDGALPETGKRSRMAQWMVKWINTFPFNILIGEGGLWYTLHLILKGQHIIQTTGITHLYSSFRPFADHYAAYCLKRWNPQLIWIADFRDLIVDPHTRHIFFPGLHQQLYKKIFRHADVLTTVSEGLAVHLKMYNQNVVTLRNGISGEIKIPTPARSPYFTITYTGSMFQEQRNAAPLFTAVASLLRKGVVDKAHIKWVYAGKDSEDWINAAQVFDMSSQLEDHGIVSGEEALRLQRESCINVLLTTSSDQLQGVLTGKMIEYFEAGSPVIGIIHGQNDPELQRLLKELSIGDTFSDRPEDQPGIESFILGEYHAWKSSGNNRKPVDTEILRQKYTMTSAMVPLIDVLSSTNQSKLF